MLGLVSGGLVAGQTKPATEAGERLAQWATVEAHASGVPVYAFGYTYVYGVSPDFRPGVVLQEGNDAPAQKIQPKKSWEIKNNLFGSTPAREPRTAANDDQPMLGIHLIDGDVRTCWASRGQNRSDFEDVWIRIDLPMETPINRVVLVGHPEGMGFDYPAARGSSLAGQAFPRRLEVRLSVDAWQWKTVYKNDRYHPQDIKGRNEISFAPQFAKQIWIIGSEAPFTHHFGHSFSVAEVEVLDTSITGTNNNVALLTRGASVQVSSTETGYGMDRFTQDMLWPVQYDLGFKWTRVGYDMGLFLWSYVEREKGKLKVDERADAVITEAVENGIEVIMCLDKGNWLYAPTPKTLDRTRDLMEQYSNRPEGGWAKVLMDHPPQLEGYLNYVRFMVRHFKDRVKYFEIWNEWGPVTYEEAKNYAKLLKPAIKIIREEYPQAKVVPASPGWVVDFAWFKALGDEGLLSQVDMIGFHPFYGRSPADARMVSFSSDFRRLKELAEGYGFKGQYGATEWTYYAPYPAVDWDFDEHTEIQKAIYAARLTTKFANLGIISLWNETFQTGQTYGAISLFRNGFSDEVICPTQPETVYYVLRTISTALEDVKGAEIPVTFTDNRRQVEQYAFVRGNGEKLVAFWLAGITETRTGSAGHLVTDVVIKGAKGEGATIIDVLNGTEKPLKVEPTSEGIVLRKIRVQSWPLIIRLPKSE